MLSSFHAADTSGMHSGTGWVQFRSNPPSPTNLTQNARLRRTKLRHSQSCLRVVLVINTMPPRPFSSASMRTARHNRPIQTGKGLIQMSTSWSESRPARSSGAAACRAVGSHCFSAARASPASARRSSSSFSEKSRDTTEKKPQISSRSGMVKVVLIATRAHFGAIPALQRPLPPSTSSFPCQHSQSAGTAGAWSCQLVTAHQAQQLPAFQRQVAVLEHCQAAVSLADALQLNLHRSVRLLSEPPVPAQSAN